MGKRMYEDLKEILCHELNEITRKGDIDKEGLDDVYKLSSAITMVESLMKKEKQGGMDEVSNHWGYEGNSNASYNMSNMSHERGVTDGRDNPRSGDYRGISNDYSRDSYDSYESYRRGRGMDGRYVSRDSYESGYSRHTAEQKVAEKLQDILETTESPKVREAIEQAMMKIKH